MLSKVNSHRIIATYDDRPVLHVCILTRSGAYRLLFRERHTPCLSRGDSGKIQLLRDLLQSNNCADYISEPDYSRFACSSTRSPREPIEMLRQDVYRKRL